MTHKFNGNILVTGAATGVGLAIVKILSSSGYHILAAVLPGQDITELQKAQPVKIIEADLANSEDVTSLIEKVRASGDLRAIISNAGIAVPGPVELMPIDQVHLQYQINVFAPLQIMQGLLPLLRNSSGRIIIIGAGQARLCLPNGSLYGSSKAAISAIADSLRAEVSPDGIHVSVVEPGAIRTGILKNSEERWASIFASSPKLPPEIIERYRKSMNKSFQMSSKAFKSAMEPVTIAQMVADILSVRKPKPRYLVGREAKALAFIAKLPDKIRTSILLKMT